MTPIKVCLNSLSGGFPEGWEEGGDHPKVAGAAGLSSRPASLCQIKDLLPSQLTRQCGDVFVPALGSWWPVPGNSGDVWACMCSAGWGGGTGQAPRSCS